MLGVIASVLVERGNVFFRCLPQCHSGLVFPFSGSFLNGLTARWESALSRAIGGAETTSVARIFRFVGAMPIVIRMAQTLRSDYNSDSEADVEAGEQVSQAGDEHPQQLPIARLLMNPALRCPIQTPRFPIVLCHGLYGFDASSPATDRQSYTMLIVT
jgi:hypothetical protein